MMEVDICFLTCQYVEAYWRVWYGPAPTENPHEGGPRMGPAVAVGKTGFQRHGISAGSNPLQRRRRHPELKAVQFF
jgi:hypothetical protein